MIFVFSALLAFIILQIGTIIFGDFKKYKKAWKNDTLFMVLDSISTIIMMGICSFFANENNILVSIITIVFVASIFAGISQIIRHFTNIIKGR